MKKTFKTILVIATVAMASVSCQKETLKEAAQTTGMVTFSFTADLQQPKTTLTTTDDAAFAAAWKVGDKMTLFYTDKIAEDGTKQVEAVYGDGKFTFEVPAEVAGRTASWDYRALYEGVEASLFTRTQAGNAFNGDSEILNGTTEVSSAEFGKGISFSMDRLTSVLYFHLTNRGSAITEPITKAILTAGEGEVLTAKGYEVKEGHLVAKGEAEKSNKVTLNVTDGVAMNNADGIQLWFNVLPGKYSELNLVVETASYRFTIDTKDAQDGYTLAEGGLTKIVGKVKNNYELKEGEVVFGENVFDNCDYSPYVTGATVNCTAYPVLDTQNKKEGTGCYSFDITVGGNKLIGPIAIKRAQALNVSSGFTESNGHLSFYIYTDKTIDLAASANRQLVVELTTGGAPDTEEYQWLAYEGLGYKELKAGEWTKIDLPLSSAGKTGTPNLANGFNFFRVWAQGTDITEGQEYNVKIDDVEVYAKSNYDEKGFAQVTGLTGMNFIYSHPVFNAQKTHAYIVADNATLVCLDLKMGTVAWTYQHSDNASKTSGCQSPVMVNPINGDIYFTNRAKSTYCVKSDGTLKWVNKKIDALGSGLALNNDGTILFVAGNGSIVTSESGSRRLSAVNAETGEIIATKYSNVESDGISGSMTYTGFAQLLVVDDTHVILSGAEHYQVYEFDYANKKCTRIKWAKTNASPYTAYSKASDYSSAAANKDYAFFCGQSGALLVVKLSDYSIKTATIESSKIIYSVSLDNAGNLYTINNNAHIKKYAVSDVVNGGTPTALFTGTVGSSDSMVRTFSYPSSSGKIYNSVNNGGCCSIFSTSMASTGNVTLSKTFSCPLGTVDYDGCFAMTDGYGIVATKSKGTLYMVKTNDTVLSGTWSYYGGDPCGTKNIKWVYGNN